jgi:hypothetical protein
VVLALGAGVAAQRREVGEKGRGDGRFGEGEGAGEAGGGLSGGGLGNESVVGDLWE